MYFYIVELMALVLLLLQCQADKAPEVAPLINRDLDWCSNGSITATTVSFHRIFVLSYSFNI